MYNFWSVVPPLVAIGLAISTRRVFFSLFTSIWVGGMILTGGNPFVAVGASFDWIKDVQCNQEYQRKVQGFKRKTGLFNRCNRRTCGDHRPDIGLDWLPSIIDSGGLCRFEFGRGATLLRISALYPMEFLLHADPLRTGKDFGPMAKAELRVMKTGKLIEDGIPLYQRLKPITANPLTQIVPLYGVLSCHWSL